VLNLIRKRAFLLGLTQVAYRLFTLINFKTCKEKQLVMINKSHTNVATGEIRETIATQQTQRRTTQRFMLIGILGKGIQETVDFLRDETEK
jgi:hypothetical protein